MASSNFSFLKGNSINRPVVFNDEGHHYWITRMQIFIEAIDLNIWEAIEIGPFTPTMVVGNATIEKPREQQDEDEKRRVQYNLKAKNIITSTLGMDEYFRISNCKNAKEMWDTVQVTNEGTTDVKRSETLSHMNMNCLE